MHPIDVQIADVNMFAQQSRCQSFALVGYSGLSTSDSLFVPRAQELFSCSSLVQGRPLADLRSTRLQQASGWTWQTRDQGFGLPRNHKQMHPRVIENGCGCISPPIIPSQVWRHFSCPASHCCWWMLVTISPFEHLFVHCELPLLASPRALHVDTYELLRPRRLHQPAAILQWQWTPMCFLGEPRDTVAWVASRQTSA